MKDEGERQALGFRLPPPSRSRTMADKLGSGRDGRRRRPKLEWKAEGRRQKAGGRGQKLSVDMVILLCETGRVGRLGPKGRDDRADGFRPGAAL